MTASQRTLDRVTRLTSVTIVPPKAGNSRRVPRVVRRPRVNEGETVATVKLTGTNFDTVVKDNDMVLVDFWASWCGPCRIFAPVYEKVSEAHDDIVFGKVDTDAEIELAQAYNISSIPTLMV